MGTQICLKTMLPILFWEELSSFRKLQLPTNAFNFLYYAAEEVPLRIFGEGAAGPHDTP